MRLIADVFDQVRTAFADGRAVCLRATVGPEPTTGLSAIRVVVRFPDTDEEAMWTAPGSARPTDTPAFPEATGTDPYSSLVQALADHDNEARAVVDMLDWYRTELETTNQGVLALHTELDAANRAQAELLTAEQAARELADTARRRLTFLSTASAALSSTLDHRTILHELAGLPVPEFAATAHVWLLDDRQELIALSKGTPDASELSADHPALRTARTGRTHHSTKPPHHPAAGQPARPLLSLPLSTGRATLGVLALTPSASAERFALDDIVMLTELARRAATALDNAQRYEHERDTAEILQRAMLTDLPAAPGLRMAARYLPASEGMNIGGDWYDAFLHPDGTLTTVIGDVTGHGLDAAILMGQLRHALRAYALQGHPPGALLTLLHTLMRSLQPDLYATAVVTQHRPGNPEVTWASAGHLPPLLRTPDGTVQILDNNVGSMLGLPLNQTVHDHQLTLAHGSTLLLYTDGLVERRAHGIDLGIHRLATALTNLTPQAAGTPEEAAETLLDELLHDSPRDDDICLLLCHAVHAAQAQPTRDSVASRRAM
ncbi:phosphatase [Streptomyces ambofaciens]|uniref:Phosphatase n=1 Tax=Streptomyces ambofaciens TaxID=1889 RepID=A0ABN4PH05_STRAM|nr:GAF domain-containing SpoIIE family protein phosphatase [Streptomyces ambofaciens]ANB10587.1 phosphatase [Streptomyces ambofaciens]